MTDAPEKMWVFPKKDWFNAGASTHSIMADGAKDVEYTRTDIADDRIAELEEALESILKIPNSEAAQGIMKVFAHSALGDKT
tara:strand:+ start:295 stop:540 length:246 start_codon:yes stop_codon:yes gene_type:complete